MNTIAIPEWLAWIVSFVIDRPPLHVWLVGTLVGWVICPAYMYVLAVLSEWRWPRFNEQFKAFMPGNLFLGVGFGSACYLAAIYNGQHHGQVGFFAWSAWGWICWAVGLLVVVVLSVLDVMGALSQRPARRWFLGRDGKAHDESLLAYMARVIKETPMTKATYSWYQLISWAKVFHNIFVYGVYGTLLPNMAVPGLGWASWNAATIAARSVFAVAFVAWVVCLIIDIKKPKHKTGHVELRGARGVVQWFAGLLTVYITIHVLVAL